MSDPMERLTDQLISPPEQAIPADELVRVDAAIPTPDEAGWAPLDTPEVVLTEEELQRLVVDEVLGRRRVLPSDPRAAAVAERIWAELDARPRGAVVDVPPSIPGATGTS